MEAKGSFFVAPDYLHVDGCLHYLSDVISVLCVCDVCVCVRAAVKAVIKLGCDVCASAWWPAHPVTCERGLSDSSPLEA